LLDSLGIRADVMRLNEDFRRNDFWKLRNGERELRDQANDHGDDGDHHRNDGTINEELGHGIK